MLCFFLKIAMYQKNCEILHFVHGSEAQSQMEVFFDFFSFYYHLGTVSCQITFFKKLNNLSFSTKFYVFFWRLQCTKKLRNSPLCPREWSSITNGSFLRFFLFSLPFRNSIMPNNMFSKNSIILSFSTKFYVFFWRLQCTKKLRNSPLCEPEWTSITNGSFLRFFLFLLPFRNSIMPNNMFSKNSIIWVFQRNFMFFFEDCNVPKNCEILHFVHGSEAQSQMEVFFDFTSFYYRLGTVLCQITLLSKDSINLRFSTKFYFFFEDCAMYQKIAKILHFVHGSKAQSQMEVFYGFFSFYYSLGTVLCQITLLSKDSIIWDFQRNFMFFFEDCNVPKNCENSPLCPRE